MPATQRAAVPDARLLCTTATPSLGEMPTEPGSKCQTGQRLPWLTCAYIRHRDISRSSRVPVAGKIQSYQSAAFGQNRLSHVIHHATGKLIYHRTVHFKISLNVYVGRTPATAATSEAGCMPFNSCQSTSINGRRRWGRGRKRVAGERVNTGGRGGKICSNI